LSVSVLSQLIKKQQSKMKNKNKKKMRHSS